MDYSSSFWIGWQVFVEVGIFGSFVKLLCSMGQFSYQSLVIDNIRHIYCLKRRIYFNRPHICIASLSLNSTSTSSKSSRCTNKTTTFFTQSNIRWAMPHCLSSKRSSAQRYISSSTMIKTVIQFRLNPSSIILLLFSSIFRFGHLHFLLCIQRFSQNISISIRIVLIAFQISFCQWFVIASVNAFNCSFNASYFFHLDFWFWNLQFGHWIIQMIGQYNLIYQLLLCLRLQLQSSLIDVCFVLIVLVSNRIQINTFIIRFLFFNLTCIWLKHMYFFSKFLRFSNFIQNVNINLFLVQMFNQITNFTLIVSQLIISNQSTVNRIIVIV